MHLAYFHHTPLPIPVHHRLLPLYVSLHHTPHPLYLFTTDYSLCISSPHTTPSVSVHHTPLSLYLFTTHHSLCICSPHTTPSIPVHHTLLPLPLSHIPGSSTRTHSSCVCMHEGKEQCNSKVLRISCSLTG